MPLNTLLETVAPFRKRLYQRLFGHFKNRCRRAYRLPKWSQDKYVNALKFATKAHLGQNVPESELPYVVHVMMVAMEVIAALDADEGLDGDLAVQCALLHDVLEDTGTPYEDIAEKFGIEVADGVLALTKSSVTQDKQEGMADSLARINPASGGQHGETGR